MMGPNPNPDDATQPQRKIFSDRSFLPEGLGYVLMLYPFWGKMASLLPLKHTRAMHECSAPTSRSMAMSRACRWSIGRSPTADAHGSSSSLEDAVLRWNGTSGGAM